MSDKNTFANMRSRANNDVFEEGRTVTIMRPWRSIAHGIALAAGIAIVVLAQFIPDMRHVGAYSLVALLSVYGIIGLINRTEITITSVGVRIRRGPLPSFGRRVRHAGALRAVRVYHDRVVTINGGVGDTFVVQGTLADDQRIVLDLVADRKRAETLRHRIESALRAPRTASFNPARPSYE